MDNSLRLNAIGLFQPFHPSHAACIHLELIGAVKSVLGIALLYLYHNRNGSTPSPVCIGEK